MTSILLLVETIKATNSDALISKTKEFLALFCAFLKSTSNFEYLQTNATAIPYVYPKLRTPKDMVR